MDSNLKSIDSYIPQTNSVLGLSQELGLHCGTET